MRAFTFSSTYKCRHVKDLVIDGSLAVDGEFDGDLLDVLDGGHFNT